MRTINVWRSLGILTILSALVFSCSTPIEPTQDEAELATPTKDLEAIKAKLSLTVTAWAFAATARAPSTSTPLPSANIADAPILSSLRIVYIRERNIFMIDRGFLEVQLIFLGMDDDVTISPDGEWIAFRRMVTLSEDHYESELRIMDKEGSFQSVLLSVEDFDSLFPMDNDLEHGGVHPHRIQFIPGSDLILFSTFTWGMYYPSHFDMHVVDMHTGQLHTLLELWEAVTTSISPNGKHIAAASQNGVHLINVASLAIQRDIVEHGIYHSNEHWIYYVYPKWAPDSSFFVIAVESDLESGNEYVYGNEIWKIHIDSHPPELLSTIATIYLHDSARWLLNATISLDLGRMYYACPASYEPDTPILLCFSDLDGKNVNRYPVPDSQYSEHPFGQEGFPIRSNPKPRLYYENWIDDQFRIGIWRDRGLVLIQTGSPQNIFLLAEGVETWDDFGYAVLE